MENKEKLDEEIIIDFQTIDKSVSAQIVDSLEDSDTEIIESSAFSGTEIVTVILPIILPSAVIILDKALNFYLQNRKNVRETNIKIGKNEISLSGFSEDEIKELAEGDTLRKLKKLAR